MQYPGPRTSILGTFAAAPQGYTYNAGIKNGQRTGPSRPHLSRPRSGVKCRLDFGQSCSTLIGSRNFVRSYLVYRIWWVYYEVQTSQMLRVSPSFWYRFETLETET
jgi:hypothetical protein